MASALRIAFLLLPFSLSGYEFFPWLCNDCELDLVPYYSARYFPSVQSDAPKFQAKEFGQVMGFESSFTVLREWSIGFFASLTQTSKMEFALNGVTFMAAHQWANDRLGDWITFTSYFLANGNTSRSARDLILYHSARWELEGHNAFGKEWVDGPTWCYRTWLDVGLGIGTTGSPYLKGVWFLEKNHRDCYSYGLFLDTWIGFANRALKYPFFGYGSVRHRNLNVGLRYVYNTDYWGSLGADFSVGAVAINYPKTPIEGRLFWHFSMGP